MPRCSFGHDADVVRGYQVMEKEPGQPPGGPSKVLDKGQTCPDHREMIITAKSDRQQDKRLAAAQRFRETSAPNEHTAAIEKSFELDKPAGEPLSHETYISGSVRDCQPPPRPRDDRDNIERGFGRDLLVHPLIVRMPLQGLGGEWVLSMPSLPAPDLQRRAKALKIIRGPQGRGAEPELPSAAARSAANSGSSSSSG